MLIQKVAKGLDVKILNHGIAGKAFILSAEGGLQAAIAILPLEKAKLRQGYPVRSIFHQTVDFVYLLTVQSQAGRIQGAMENRRRQAALDTAVKSAMAADLIRQLVLYALHVNVMHLGQQIKAARPVHHAVYIHIHHR